MRWRRFACVSEPLWEQAGGGVGARGLRAQLRPPPRPSWPFQGEGEDIPSALGG